MATARAHKAKMSGHTRLIDNPLFESTAQSSSHGRHPAAKAVKPKAVKPKAPRNKRPPAKRVRPAPDAHNLAVSAVEKKREISASMDKIKNSAKYIMSTDEEKVSVFEIISDLEKQLDAAFSLKDAQEKEINHLKEKLATIEEKAGTTEAKFGEMKGMLVAQEQLNSELEFLENERLETVERIKTMERELQARAAIIKELENKIAAFTEEVDVRNKRIEQIELELSGANKAMQGLQHQIELLEGEKDETGAKLGVTQTELNDLIAERNRYKKELERAKESLDEIRLTLADTRARAREHYYKNTRK